MENELVIELRRRRITLMSLGTGVISFGVWSILKTMLYMYMNVIRLDVTDIPPEYQRGATIAAYIMYAIFLLIGLSLRLYVGMKARAAGNGQRQRLTYIVVAGVLLSFGVLSLMLVLFSRTSGRMENQSMMDYLVSIFVEFCSTAILAELVHTAVRVRKLAKLVEG